jgi:predicted RNA-binding Zn-ribbon protein involved in translation (DUF1610 family)
MAALLVGGILLIPLGLGVWLARRRRGNKATLPAEEAASAAEANAAGIVFACPECGNRMKARADHGGKRGKCRRCSKVVVIPSEMTALLKEEDARE